MPTSGLAATSDKAALIPQRKPSSRQQLLHRAEAVLACAQIAALYSDHHHVHFLMLSDVCEVARRLVEEALEQTAD